MERNNRKLGAEYESLACEYLSKMGYEIVERNFYSHAGEIDIIAKHEGYLVFLEVKYRKNAEKGTPLEAVSFRKQKIISKCALYYMQKHRMENVPVRFDVVGILGEQMQVIQNAFDFHI